MDLYKNYLSDRSYENKRNVKKVDKALKHELRRCEVEVMDKITKDLEDAARRHDSKTLNWHVNKLRGNSQSGLVPVKDRNGATISDKARVKERWEEHFENVLNQDTVAGKDSTDSVVNEFLKYGGSEVRNKLLKITNMIFLKWEVPNDFLNYTIDCIRKPIGVSVAIIEALVLSL